MDYKSFREMLKKLFLALFIVGAFACSASPRIDLVDTGYRITPNAQQAVIVKELISLFETVHYKKVPFNDSLSLIVYHNILDALDEGKNYLLKADIKRFEPYRTTIISDFRKGDLSAVFHMFNVYEKRYLERINFAVSQIDQPFDFTKEERFVVNRENLDWFANKEEADANWRERVKYDLLRMKLSAADSLSEEKNKKTLRDRYTNLISQAEKTNANDVFQVIMNAFTAAIDPHTNYFNPSFAQAFNEDMALTFEGIGARLMIENEVVKITEIIPGGPADKSKTLNVNDRIVGVAQGDDEFVDIVGWRLDKSVSKIKGPKGTKVRLKIIPSGQDLTAKPKIVSLVRDRIIIEDQAAKKSVKTVTDDKGHTYKIGIITLPQFYLDFKAYNANNPNYKSASRDVALILDTLKKEAVDAVVLDLRGNGGGSLVEAIKLTGLFIDKGPVVQVRDTRNRIEVDRDEEAGVAWDGPLGVMINRLSASASEIFAAAIQDYGRGIVLGTQSYGKGTVQSAIDMSRVISPTNRLLLKAQTISDSTIAIGENAPEFGQINLTMAKFYRINGSSTQHKGVMPDIAFPMVIPKDEFGESAEPSALPWDQIKTTQYNTVANLEPIITKLQSNHKVRMEKSPEYGFMLEDIREIAERKKEVSVTLNEAKLKEEREKAETENLARINARRKLQGLPLLKKGDTLPADTYDFVLDESLQVMADLVTLKASQPVVAQNQ